MVHARTRYVPSRATWSSVTSVADTPVASTNLKRNLRNTEDSPRDWIQLHGVNDLLVSTWKTDLCEYNAILNSILHSPLGRSVHQWGVSC